MTARRAGAALLLLLLVVAAAGCGGNAPGRHEEHGAHVLGAHAAGGAAAPVRLTLRQSIGQHFVFAYRGTHPPAALRRRIARGEAAGVIVFSRNVRSAGQLRATMAALQRIRRPPGLDVPLLVMVDQEGGSVRRIPGPPATGAGQTTGAAAARGNGRAAARLLRSAGVNVDLAPVVDVARPGSVLEREGRAYGRDPATVVARAGAFAAALRAGGVQPVLKHFPGFGAAALNTDDGRAFVDVPLATLRRVDLAPYRALHPRAVMLSTAVYRAVDPRPAAFSPRWVTRELRGRLGFRGVAVTDDLQAPAVARFGTPPQLALFALAAGVDVPIFAKDYTAASRAANGLEDLVRRRAITRAALDAGARRVLTWRRTLR